MDRRSGSILDMGSRVVLRSRARPDSDAGFTLSLAKLDELVTRGQQAATAQREAKVDQRTATAQKRVLRRAVLSGPVAHLAGVGRMARKEDPELAKAFLAQPGDGRYASFLTNARAMQTAAQANKEVLLKYGLSEAVLEQLGVLLDQFDAALLLGRTGRSNHKGATVELERLATQISQTVRVMEGRIRQRFEDDPQALGAWLSARRVLGEPKSGGPERDDGSGEAPVEGDVRPAA